MTLSDIGCLRLDWLRDLFAFVGRYQLELEQMRKVCRDRLGPAASGACPTCDKYIKVNTWQGTQHTRHGEGWKPGSMVSNMDSHSRTVAQYEQAIHIWNSH